MPSTSDTVGISSIYGGEDVNAQSGDVGGSNRHLAQEELEAYSSGRLASARLSYCQTHLDSCEACRAELEDLRTFKADLAAFPRPEAIGLGARKRRRRGLPLVPVAVGAAIVFAVVAAGVWWWRGGLRLSRAPEAAVVTQTSAVAMGSGAAGEQGEPAPVVSAPVGQTARAPVGATPVGQAARVPVGTAPVPQATQAPVAQGARAPAAQVAARMPAAPAAQNRSTRFADDIAALPDDLRPAVSAAIQHGKLQLPAEVSRFRERAATFPPPEANTGFALLSPFGEAISDPRPEFSWQPLAGARHYSVVIVDAGLHRVQRSPALRTTVWRARRPLRRGRTYLWQVTATMRNGSKVVASAPPPSEAFLEIIPLQLADEMAHFRQGHQEAHLVLGTLYAQAGMLTEGADELGKVAPGDPSYNTARALLRDLSSPTNTYSAQRKAQ